MTDLVGAGTRAEADAHTVGGSADPRSVRAEVVSWLAESWDGDLPLIEWRRRLVEARWAVPSWPTRWYGRELPGWSEDIVAEELQRCGAVGVPFSVAMGLSAPTLLEHARDDLADRYLPRILTGEHVWCQLFSEPDAGSDLAGLTTRAELHGDRWVVNGQKLWTTSAHHADFALLLARTDWDAPKHRGLTFFVLPMNQDGITVRPVRQMNGHASFNEVFLEAAEIPADHVVGEVGGGWAVARTTLAHERRFAARRRARISREPGRAREEARRELAEHFAPYVWYPQRAGRVDLLIEGARTRGRQRDPLVRQAIARCLTVSRINKWTAARASANRAAGRKVGPEGSIAKLAASELARLAAHAHSLIAGPAATLTGEVGALGGVVAEILTSVPAQSIAGGTDEIQKNILAENMLGLPREVSEDAEWPFRDRSGRRA
jgi:alkylation response protein AidB-like acyl-CoA dehydrogenase